MIESKNELFDNLMLGVCLLGTLSAFGPVAQAGESQPAYTMTVIADRAQGDRVVAGDYGQAIAQIAAETGKRSDQFAVSNNLCVAYTKLNDLPKAEVACSEALRISKEMYGSWYDSDRKRNYHALALSNRGVIRAVSGDAQLAREDFLRARRLSDTLAAPSENLARLEAEMTQTVSSRVSSR
ncbi:MAG: hypothetical protein WD795_01655 [Woeseia sp.]